MSELFGSGRDACDRESGNEMFLVLTWTVDGQRGPSTLRMSTDPVASRDLEFPSIGQKHPKWLIRPFQFKNFFNGAHSRLRPESTIP